MSLFEYYKSHLYEYAYNKGYNDYMKGNPNPCSDQEDIYWKDEMDYNICADYYGSCVGSIEDWSDEDKEFMKVLGFVPEDFEDFEG